MLRIPALKLASFAAIGALTLLGACAAMERDTLFENNGPPPRSAEPRAGRQASAPATNQGRASATSPQETAQGTPSQQSESAGQAPPPSAQAQAATPAAPSTATSFTDAQLQSFVTASRQIEPLNRQVATATPEQRSALATQIRGILTQNNLDGATYNAIATRAQTDQALASRIAALQGNPNG